MNRFSVFMFAILAGAISAVTVSTSFAVNCGYNDFCAEYFDNRFLRGDPVQVKQVDPPINFDWGTGPVVEEVCVKNCSKSDGPSPVYDNVGVGVGRDNFSARYEGEFEFYEGGEYKFWIGSDDGVRLFIDDEIVFDRWFDRSFTVEEFTRHIEHGSHKVRLEYYERGVSARVILNWRPL